MATMKLIIKVPYRTRFFQVGRMVGIWGTFTVLNIKTFFMVFKLNRCKYVFTLDHPRRKA